MKKFLLPTICLSMGAPLFAAGTSQLTNETDRVSYAIGMMTGHQWKRQDIPFDADVRDLAHPDQRAPKVSKVRACTETSSCAPARRRTWW